MTGSRRIATSPHRGIAAEPGEPVRPGAEVHEEPSARVGQEVAGSGEVVDRMVASLELPEPPEPPGRRASGERSSGSPSPSHAG